MKRRRYKFSDSLLLGHSGEVRRNLKTDLPDFTNFDEDLNQEKEQELADAETAAFAVGTHDEFLAKSRMLTDRVNASLKACQDTFANFRYFLKKHFKGEPSFIKQFSVSKFNRIRNNQDDMVLFYSTLARVIRTNRKALVAKGIKKDLLDSIAPTGDRLKAANDEQDAFLKTQPVDTTQRVTIFNKLYGILVEFSDAAGFVYKDRPDKRAIYTLPQNGPASDDDEFIDNPEADDEDDPVTE